jgi:glycosyltransferase 2 family protein
MFRAAGRPQTAVVSQADVKKRPRLGTTGRALATLFVTGLCTAYVLWKIDLRQTLHVLANANLVYFGCAALIMTAAVVPMAWRWKQLLAARGVSDSLGWLTRTYFVSYAAGQVLPTSLGGDAARIYSGSRRHPGQGSAFTGSVLLERALGGAATLTLAALGFALAVGHYDVGPYLWIEALFIVATVLGAVVLFSRSARKLLAKFVPLLRWARVERPLRAAYEALHAYRWHGRLLIGVFALTLAVQAVRVSAIWFVGKAVGVDLPLRPYYVMGPMLFLVMLVPFTINGVAVREAFFVSFLGRLGVDPDAAFATGFLFFLLAVVVSIPGAVILARDGVIGARRTRNRALQQGDAEVPAKPHP